MKAETLLPKPASTGGSTSLPADSMATRQTLLKHLRNKEDQASWQEFFDTYWGLIYRMARSAGLSDADAQDVVQETVISVARKIDGFVYDPKKGSFRGWLLHLTRWRILNRLEQKRREAARLHVSMPTEAENRTATIDRVPDPAADDFESRWDQEWMLSLLRTAEERVKHRVTATYYQIYDYCVHEQVPVSKVSKLLGVNIAKVYLAKHRVGRIVKEELERLNRQIEMQEKVS